MKDLFGREVTMEEARALARLKPATARHDLITVRAARGVHPHNGFPLRTPAGETCGSCKHHVARSYSKTYHKCDLGQMSMGAATDIRVRWPACSKWEPTK